MRRRLEEGRWPIRPSKDTVAVGFYQFVLTSPRSLGTKGLYGEVGRCSRTRTWCRSGPSPSLVELWTTL